MNNEKDIDLKDLDADRITNFTKEQKADSDTFLENVGFDPVFWELLEHKQSTWEQKSKEGDKTLSSCKIKVKPRDTPKFDPEEFAKKLVDICKNIKLSKISLPASTRSKNLDDKKLMLISAIELHLGKLAYDKESGSTYNYQVSENRFNKILSKILEDQSKLNCGECLVIIGNDYYNADGITEATTRGTPQQVDLRWQEMFSKGLELYINLFENIKYKFNKINVKLVAGNHARSTEFYLYTALAQRYSNDKTINFSEDIKETQSFLFGVNSLYFNHGDVDESRLIKSLPSEFPEDWTKSLIRDLHLYHYHKNATKVDQDLGLTVIRNPSPCSSDYWHYHNRYVGIIPSYNTYIYDYCEGKISTNTINFLE
jgi:hypothetical protein